MERGHVLHHPHRHRPINGRLKLQQEVKENALPLEFDRPDDIVFALFHRRGDEAARLGTQRRVVQQFVRPGGAKTSSNSRTKSACEKRYL
jgi:hypothetical protein